jgi:hypothetical protein
MGRCPQLYVFRWVMALSRRLAAFNRKAENEARQSIAQTQPDGPFAPTRNKTSPAVCHETALEGGRFRWRILRCEPVFRARVDLPFNIAKTVSNLRDKLSTGASGVEVVVRSEFRSGALIPPNSAVFLIEDGGLKLTAFSISCYEGDCESSGPVQERIQL